MLIIQVDTNKLWRKIVMVILMFLIPCLIATPLDFGTYYLQNHTTWRYLFVALCPAVVMLVSNGYTQLLRNKTGISKQKNIALLLASIILIAAAVVYLFVFNSFIQGVFNPPANVAYAMLFFYFGIAITLAMSVVWLLALLWAKLISNAMLCVSLAFPLLQMLMLETYYCMCGMNFEDEPLSIVSHKETVLYCVAFICANAVIYFIARVLASKKS